MSSGELTFELKRDDAVDSLTYLTTTTADLTAYTSSPLTTYEWKVSDLCFTSTIEKTKSELPERVIFSDPATILIWENGDKTVVKTSKGDKYNPLYGFLMAYFKYTSGLNSSKRDKYFKKIMEENEKNEKDKK